MQKGKLIIVDGPDGSGKTTICNLIKSMVEKIGKEAIVVKAIGEGPIGQRIRERLFNGTDTPKDFEALMMAASTMECYYDIVKPALVDGKIVIMDRWVSSFFAYQVRGRKSIPAEGFFNSCYYDFHRRAEIDLFILMDSDPSVNERRILSRFAEANYLDHETKEFKAVVAKGFDDFFYDYVLDLDIDGSRLRGDRDLSVTEGILQNSLTRFDIL